MLEDLHNRWQRISRLWLGILMFGSYAAFLAFQVWWDGMITFERQAMFLLLWCCLNLLRECICCKGKGWRYAYEQGPF